MASLLNMSGSSLLKKRLPYDAEIEYLESTGTQVIDSGLNLYVGLQKIKGIIDIIFKTSESTSKIISYSHPNAGVQIYTNSNYLYNQASNVTYTKNQRYIASFVTTNTLREITLNNVRVAQNFSRSIQDGTRLYILGGSPSFSSCSCIIFSYKLYFNDELVRDYIPVRIGTTGYMYDKVSGQLFGNSGTGNFVLGNDI